MQAASKAWIETQPDMDIEKLVFIDETWASTSMTRRYERAPREQRCIGSASHGHWKTTFVGGLRHDRLTATMLTGKPMDGTPWAFEYQDDRTLCRVGTAAHR